MARIMLEPPPPLAKWRTDAAPALDAICQAARAPARAGPPRRRRRRLRLPEWFVPLITGGAALIAVAYVLAFFYSYLVQQRVLRPELTAVEEQRRLVEGQRLADALARLRATPDDADARRDLDAWLDGAGGRRTDLPPEVNLGLGQYLILARDPPRWDSGLRRLRLGTPGPLRQAAEEDLAAAAGDARAKLRSGDTWWALAAPEPERSRY